MKSKKNDYSRFYALLKQNPHADKEELVSQFTGGRTTHVSQMKPEEFRQLCDALQYGSPSEREAQNMALKRARSAALLRIGRIGINTIDNWEGINAFCLSPKIAGKEFRKLSLEELDALIKKLELIIRKGGLKTQEQKECLQESQSVEAESLETRQKAFYLPLPVPGRTKYLS